MKLPQLPRWLLWTMAVSAIVVALVPLYLLSVGPVYGMYCREQISMKAYDRYSHIAWRLIDMVDNKSADNAFNSYLDLWQPSGDWFGAD